MAKSKIRPGLAIDLAMSDVTSEGRLGVEAEGFSELPADIKAAQRRRAMRNNISPIPPEERRGRSRRISH